MTSRTETRAGTFALTAIAMLAFAGNSVLCRAALSPGEAGPAIDAVAFTAIRIGSGATILLPALFWGRPSAVDRAPGTRGGGPTTLFSGVALLTYALAFSWSYASLPAGVGALILFGCVQLTMLGVARFEGERIGLRRWVGAAIAFGGLGLLMAPASQSLAGVDPIGAGLMALAGVGWGIYTLLGRGAKRPTRATAVNFLAALCGALVFLGVFDASVSQRGVGLAIASGAVCSGLGYAIWYRALRGHSAASASISQLTVPILAAVLGALALGEPLTLTWAASSALVIAGVALGLGRRT